MTPFEIALSIHNRADPDEDLQAFVLRTTANETMADVMSAATLCIGWANAFDELQALFDILAAVAVRTPGVTVEAMIAAKRKLGYDPKLEALLARRWRCPHCKQFSTINKVGMPLENPGGLPVCALCGEEGIAPVEIDARLTVRDGGKSGLRPL